MAFSANVVLRVLPFGDPTKVDFPRAALVRLTLDHLQYLQERISREEVIMRRGIVPERTQPVPTATPLPSWHGYTSEPGWQDVFTARRGGAPTQYRFGRSGYRVLPRGAALVATPLTFEHAQLVVTAAAALWLVYDPKHERVWETDPLRPGALACLRQEISEQ